MTPDEALKVAEEDATTERWEPVPGYPNYLISSSGRVMSATRGKGPLRPYKTAKGYLAVQVYDAGIGHRLMIHRAVLLTFIRPPRPKEQARHLNCDSTDNRVENLAWGTATENAADSIRLGRHMNGERHHSAKLDWSKIRTIRWEHRDTGISARKLAKRYGVSPSVIDDVLNDRTWREQFAPRLEE